MFLLAVILVIGLFILASFLVCLFASKILSKDVSDKPKKSISQVVVDYLSEEYSEFVDADIHSRLSSDIGMDSLDIYCAIEYFADYYDTDISTSKFIKQYGTDATVNDLVNYIRVTIAQSPNHHPSA